MGKKRSRAPKHRLDHGLARNEIAVTRQKQQTDPGAGYRLTQEKKAFVEPIGDTNHNPAQWTMSSIDAEPLLRNVHWNLTPTELMKLLAHLEDMPKKTWNQWLQETSNGHRKHHSQDVDTLSKEARQRLLRLADFLPGLRLP